MKKGCLLLVVAWLVIAGIYFAFFRWRGIESPGDWICAILGSTSLLVFIGAIRGIEAVVKDARAIRRAEAGFPFEDGKLVAAIGRIEPLGQSLKTPFQRESCVAYEYEVFSQRASATTERKTPDFSGYALVPSVIKTQSGNVRLLGYAILNQFKKYKVRDEQNYQNASVYYAETIFENMGVSNVSPLKVFSAITDILSDDDGTVRKDWRTVSEEVSWNDCDLSERFVGVGEQVCALGIYSAEKQGLVPQWGWKSMVNRLFPGDGATTRKKLFGEARFSFIAGTIFFILMHGFLVVLVYLRMTNSSH